MTYAEAEKKLRQAAQLHPLHKVLLQHNGKIVVGRGSSKPGILFIGEAPGFDEISQGQPFVGRSGQVLDKWISEHNIVRYAVVNAVPLIPLDEAGKIRAPTDDELNYFKPYTLALIHELNPEFIVCLGKTAAKLYGLDIPPGSVKGNIGFCHHPAYYLRNSTDGKEDFASVIKKIINENIINFTVEYSDCDFDFAIKDFLEKIGAKYNA